tara:strand:- start:2676 stop:2909 length:234 start_codon:yes stop_codon:yes gene_type:complete
MSEETNTTTQEADKCTTCQCPNFVRDNIMTRLKQESTWRGLITVATLVGWQVQPDQADTIITAGVSLVGAINIFKRD